MLLHKFTWSSMYIYTEKIILYRIWKRRRRIFFLGIHGEVCFFFLIFVCSCCNLSDSQTVRVTFSHSWHLNQVHHTYTHMVLGVCGSWWLSAYGGGASDSPSNNYWANNTFIMHPSLATHLPNPSNWLTSTSLHNLPLIRPFSLFFCISWK